MNLPRLAFLAGVCLLLLSTLLVINPRLQARAVENHIPARYIVQLREDHTDSQNRYEFAANIAAEFNTSFGANADTIYSSAITGFVIETADAISEREAKLDPVFEA